MNEAKTSQSGQADYQCVEAIGPWPFVTRRAYRLADQSMRTWSSRHHRKGLVLQEAAKTTALAELLMRCLWMPQRLNWWMGVIFATGSLFFMTASFLCLLPTLAKSWALDSMQINAIFFAGSIFFTVAAYLQLFQAANAREFFPENLGLSKRATLFGWRPADIGWLSSALQFVGTILFNFNTFDAMIPSLNWFQQDLLIWVPDVAGSVLFLVSGYLAFIETCCAHWAWKPKSISWWVVSSNLLGCVGFMASAVLAIVLPGLENTAIPTLSVACTLLGAAGFFIGSLLMLPESAIQGQR